MMDTIKPFDTNAFFAGGAGMFVQYHDVIKPVYLYAVIRMILTGEDHGLPTWLIKDFSQLSILEWYLNRRYINPLRQLDYNHQLDPGMLDQLLQTILANDPTIYKLSPELATCRLFQVYRQQHMSFPIYIYTPVMDEGIQKDCDHIFGGIQYRVLEGDLRSAIEKCDQNFTYIFSDIELVKNAAEILVGTCSHILLTRDYRYNHGTTHGKFRYDLMELSHKYPFVRIGTTIAVDPQAMSIMFRSLTQGGD